MSTLKEMVVKNLGFWNDILGSGGYRMGLKFDPASSRLSLSIFKNDSDDASMKTTSFSVAGLNVDKDLGCVACMCADNIVKDILDNFRSLKGSINVENANELAEKIFDDAKCIGERTRRNLGNFVVTSPTVSTYLTSSKYFVNRSVNDISGLVGTIERDFSVENQGATLTGREIVKIFCSLECSQDNLIVVGYKGQTGHDAGLFLEYVDLVNVNGDMVELEYHADFSPPLPDCIGSGEDYYVVNTVDTTNFTF